MSVASRSNATASPAWGERQRLASLTVPLAMIEPFALPRLAPDAPRVFWREPNGTVTYVGLGAAATLRADGATRIARLQLQIDHLFEDATIDGDGPAAAAPRLFGGLSFNAAPKDDDPAWADFGAACFVLPHLLVTFNAGSAWLTVSRNIDPHAAPDPLAALRDEAEAFRAGLADLPVRPAEAGRARLKLRPVLSQDDWRAMVTAAVGRIQVGELRKVVLSRAVDARCDRPLDPVSALERLDARYPDTFRFLFEPSGRAAFFGASPELLAEVRASVLHTAALAGSRRRGDTPDEDAALAAELLASPKEREEHQIVVDSVLERVTPFARRVSAPATPDILRLSNIQHLHTPVRAELETHFDALDLVAELHPTPALGGYPVRAAMAAIDELEPFERGWFASPVGWIDARGDGVFAVAIRSAVARDAEARLYAGAGIVAESVPDQEWDETGLKFRPLLHALDAEETAG